jgi:hypothetical protein
LEKKIVSSTNDAGKTRYPPAEDSRSQSLTLY